MPYIGYDTLSYMVLSTITRLKMPVKNVDSLSLFFLFLAPSFSTTPLRAIRLVSRSLVGVSRSGEVGRRRKGEREMTFPDKSGWRIVDSQGSRSERGEPVWTSCFQEGQE